MSSVTEACLNRVGNLPLVKERFAMCAIISENTAVARAGAKEDI